MSTYNRARCPGCWRIMKLLKTGRLPEHTFVRTGVKHRCAHSGREVAGFRFSQGVRMWDVFGDQA